MIYLELSDYLLIAQAATGVDAQKLARLPRLTLAESALAAPAAMFGGVEFYPSLEEKAAVLCWHLARNHPLPDGNKRAAYLSMREFVERNGRRWIPPHPDEGEKIVLGVATGEVSVEALTAWVRTRTADT